MPYSPFFSVGSWGIFSPELQAEMEALSKSMGFETFHQEVKEATFTDEGCIKCSQLVNKMLEEFKTIFKVSPQTNLLQKLSDYSRPMPHGGSIGQQQMWEASPHGRITLLLNGLNQLYGELRENKRRTDEADENRRKEHDTLKKQRLAQMKLEEETYNRWYQRKIEVINELVELYKEPAKKALKWFKREKTRVNDFGRRVVIGYENYIDFNMSLSSSINKALREKMSTTPYYYMNEQVSDGTITKRIKALLLDALKDDVMAMKIEREAKRQLKEEEETKKKAAFEAAVKVKKQELEFFGQRK